jgi:hypothetical protein
MQFNVQPGTIGIEVQHGRIQDAKRVQLKSKSTLANCKLSSVGSVQAVDTIGSRHSLLPLVMGILSSQRFPTPNKSQSC